MSRKNVVLIVLDDTLHRTWDFLPYLTSRPGGNWVDFPNSFIHAPQCAPARTTFLTGLFSTHHGVTSVAAADDAFEGGIDPYKTLPVALRNAGYRTGFAGKYQNGYPWNGNGGSNTYQPPGWDDWHGIYGGQTYNYSAVENGVATSYGETDADYKTDVIFNLAETFISATREPFFLMLTPTAPHEPAVPASRHAGLHAATALDLPPTFNEADGPNWQTKPQWLREQWPNPRATATVDKWEAEMRNAWASLKAVDEGIEQVIDALTAAGTLDDTVIMVLGDNSNMFLEHRMVDKRVPWEECIRAWLMVRWPGATDRSCSALVSDVDIAPTIARIAGAKMPIASDGMDFSPVVTQTVADADFRRELYLEMRDAAADRPAWRGIRTADTKWVEWEDANDGRELYDLTADPYEQVNLADTDDATRAVMASRLARIKP